jgi:drug/metabolite transporter (DMT)-like permease
VSGAGDRRLRGYAEIGISSLILGTAATLIQVSTMPASMLVVLRMGLAGAVLAVVYFLTGGPAEVRASGHMRRIWLVGFVVAVEMLFYYLAVRLSNVTVAISLEYMAPVWVVIAAPLVLHTRRQRIDVVAMSIALGGMALILAPTLVSAAAGGHVVGLVFGLLTGVCFAAAMILIKTIGPGVRGSTLTLFYCLGSVILLSPLAAWQAWTSHYHFTSTDVWIVLVSGLVYTALCFSLYSDGLRYVRVEHAGILGYLEPVTAPLWAFLFIGEVPPWSAVAGGALIVAAGLLVILLGGGQVEALPEPFT